MRISDWSSDVCSSDLESVGETANQGSVVRAARWHDLGKAHKVFQHTMHGDASAPPPYLAKSPRKARHSRDYFRHELASMLGWLAQKDRKSTRLNSSH